MKKITIRRILLCTLVLITGGCNLPSPGHVPAPADQTGTAAEIPAETKKAAVQKHTAAPVSRADLTPTLTFTPSPVPTDTPTPTPTFGPTPTPTLGPGYFHGSLGYDIGFVSQEGLKMGSKPVNTGCTPASIQMVLDFWHQYNEDYPTMSAQQMININVSQNQFRSSSGMNIMDAEDELRNMGYYLGSRTDSDKEELLAALERYGPVLVLTKVNWTPFGANHMAVVTGYDPDSGYIRLMDP